LPSESDRRRFALALLVIGIFLFLVPISGSGGTVFRTIIGGGSPILTGSNGQVTLSDGTTVQATLIPVGELSFKTQILVNYEDGTQEVVFERSNLPSLSVIGIRGKAMKNLLSTVVVSFASPQPLPTAATALFRLNHTVLVNQLDKMKWIYREVSTQFIDGRFALTMLPPFSVGPTDIFPVVPTTNEQRRVSFALTARVSVQAPGYQQLNLLGSTLSFADVDFAGTVITACADCGVIPGDDGITTDGAMVRPYTIGGAMTIQSATDTATAAITNPTPIRTEGTHEEPSAEPPDGGFQDIIISSSKDPATGIERVTLKLGTDGKDVQQGVSRETASESGGFVDAGGRSTKQYHGAQLSVVPYWRLEWTGMTYLINQNFILLSGFFLLVGMIGYMLGRRTH